MEMMEESNVIEYQNASKETSLFYYMCSEEHYSIANELKFLAFFMAHLF